jgi:predicted ArsR family transcriptional regulator
MTSEQFPLGQPIHDPRVLRAIAHPTRGRILDEMYAAGSMRAADVARVLGIPANQASFHLRQLAKYGLIEEAPDEGRDQRDRVWRPTSERGIRLDLKEMEEAPGGKSAVSVWRRSSTAWAHGVVEAAYAGHREDDTFRSITDQPIRLTKDEAKELALELDEVLVRWAGRTRGGDERRRTYLLFSMLQPYPELADKDREDRDQGTVS